MPTPFQMPCIHGQENKTLKKIKQNWGEGYEEKHPRKRKIRNVGQKALSTGCFSSQPSLYRGIWRLYATVPPNIDTNTSWVGWGVGLFLIQAAMTQSKQFTQTTFLAHNWTHGEKGVRSRPHFLWWVCRWWIGRTTEPGIRSTGN